MIESGRFWYLGTPYSKYPLGLDAAFEMACVHTATLADLGIPVYSPIAHSHPVARFVSASPTDHDYWVRFDAPMVAAAGGLIVVQADGWENSRGLQHEILSFIHAGKPVYYWDPQNHPRVDKLTPTR